MKYYLFIDESGDHGLINIDATFPIFVLCGIIVSEAEYEKIDVLIKNIKKEFWGEKKVIFHSRNIRKCDKEFAILLDLETKQRFYDKINKVVSNSNYTIISSVIDKEKYINRYGRITNDVYEISLSFIIERTIKFLDGFKETDKSLKIILEKRGKYEDKKLDEHFQRICSRGTGRVNSEQLSKFQIEISFNDKKENDSGLQLSDLIAYPIARYIIDQERANPSFDLILNKFYVKNGKRYGLKVFP